MSVPALKPLDIDAFLAFTEGREGRWELYDGAAVAMSPERVVHGTAKFETGLALRQAIRQAVLRCQAFVETLIIRMRDDRAFVPDAAVVYPPPPRDAIVIDNPLIVVEVLSPATAALDHGIKVQGYFSLPSLAHYLILDADRRVVIHHSRGEGDRIVTRFVSEGALPLDPPGLVVEVADLFGPDDLTAPAPLP
jgi:Uma2 family endonuclease